MEIKTIKFNLNVPTQADILANYFDISESEIITLKPALQLNNYHYEYLINNMIIYICPASFWAKNAEYNCIVIDNLNISGNYYNIKSFDIGNLSEKLKLIYRLQRDVFQEIKSKYKYS